MSRRPTLPIAVEDTQEYQYVLTNFRIAHEKVEGQRMQLEEQEQQVAQLRARLQLLEGRVGLGGPGGGPAVDDFSIKNTASQLDKLINRWASEIIQRPPVPLARLYDAALADLGRPDTPLTGTPAQVQALLRHALAETVSEGFINALLVTSSKDANVQLTRIHEHIFARDPSVAAVWRRQTFSAAVDACTPDLARSILAENVPTLTRLLGDAGILPSAPIEAAFAFSRMLHASPSPGVDAFYRSFVPEVGSAMYPSQIELVKRCLKNERGEVDRVGCTLFPGLVKVGSGEDADLKTVVRRAQVICECALTPRQQSS